MASQEEIVERVLGFSEPEFFATSPETLGPRESRLLDMDFRGIAINAPRRLSAEREKLPIVLAIRCSGDREWDLPLAENCILVATHLTTGKVALVPLLKAEQEGPDRHGRQSREAQPRGPKPPGLALSAAQVTSLDARRPLKVFWGAGPWAFTILSYDWRSNAVSVDVEADQPPPAKPLVVHPLPQPGGVLPTYLPSARTPNPPAQGADFKIQYRAQGDHRMLQVDGAFTVPARAGHLLPAPIVLQDKQVFAIVRVTLAILEPNSDSPRQYDWAIPIYGDRPAIGAPLKGTFSLDALPTAANVPLPPGKYAAYLVVDGKVAGPQMMEVTVSR